MSPEPRWTALLLAGSRPGGDPLSRSLGTDCKPLIPVAGRPRYSSASDQPALLNPVSREMPESGISLLSSR